MNKTIIGIYGSSGFGREVLPLVRNKFSDKNSVQLVFIDDDDTKVETNGYPIISYSDFLEFNVKEKKVVIAIADNSIRQKLAEKCLADKIDIFDVVSDTTILLDNIKIGSGAILTNYTQITSNVTIGQHFHANIYSYVAHDCIIGDYVTFAPNVHCNGNVHIEDHVYVGTGAIIKQGTPSRPLKIGKGAIIGMGAVVTKNVPAGVTVIGNPAKPLSRESLRR